MPVREIVSQDEALQKVILTDKSKEKKMSMPG
jgi:hypothetical protein